MLRILFGAAALALFATRAFACNGQTGKVIFEDKYTDDSGGWNFGEDNGLLLKAPGATLAVPASDEGRGQLTFNQSFSSSQSGSVSVATPSAVVIGFPTIGAHALAFYPCGGRLRKVVMGFFAWDISTPTMITQASGSTMLTWVGRGQIRAFTSSSFPTDNKSNAYSIIGSVHDFPPLWPNSGEALYASLSAVGGSGHIVNAPMRGSESDEITLAAVEVKNGGVIQDAQWNKVTVPPQTSLNVTTTGPATLVAIWVGDSGAASVTASPNNGFTIINSQLLAACDVEAVVATKDVSTAGTYNVTWTATPTQGAHMWLVAVQKSY